MDTHEKNFRLRERWILCSEMINSYEKRIREIRMAMKLIEDKLLVFNKPPPRGYIKNLISTSLVRSRYEGISADEIISLAATDKVLIKRKTVASTLSRMKASGKVNYRKGRYYLNNE